MSAALLTRFKLFPPGVKRLDGSWGLINVEKKLDYTNFISSYANETLKVEGNKNTLSSNIWDVISSPEVGKYLSHRHPNLQFLDFSESCNLILLTHIQAIGMEEKHWIGKGRAGSSHFFKTEARNRTIIEILERTLLSEFKIFTNTIWGSAVAPTLKLAKYYALEEALERWIIYNSWIRTANFKLLKVFTDDFSSLSLIQSCLFEWEKYGAKIDILIAVNPYKLNVVLIKIKIIINQKPWIFFSNGSGNSLTQAIQKALLESIQFVPGRKAVAWNEKLTNQSYQINRLDEWQTISINFDNHPINKVSIDFTTNQQIDDHINHVLNLGDFLEIDTISTPIDACLGIYLGYARLSFIEHWSTFKGIPIV
jgi:hypothetical protein